VHRYISEIPGLPTDFSLLSEAQVDIIFNQELTEEQLSSLNNSIAVYIPPTRLLELDHTESVSILKPTVNTTSYFTFSTDYWVNALKSSENIVLGHIIVVANIDIGSYKIRVYDSLNNNVLVESNSLSNNHIQIIKLQDLVNIPTSDTLIEFQCKVIGSGTCSVKAVQYVFYKYQE
jgi:hypothetical protein